MKILFVHNYYKGHGGEDVAFSSTAALMKSYGHEIGEFTVHNSKIDKMSKLDIACQTIWSATSYLELSDVLKKYQPDVVHFFNIFPLISPSAYDACRKAKIPVIQSLDNPRLMCPAATLYRNGHLCTECIGRTPPWPAILHGCYHNSRLHTTVVSGMLTFHRLMGTWRRKVDRYLVATTFYKNLFLKIGLPLERVIVKPHFVLDDPGYAATREPGNYALFLGRLDPEKGIRTLMKAWNVLDIPLKIRGNGNLENEVRSWINRNGKRRVELVDRLSRGELSRLIRSARFLVWSSEGYYETFGLAAIECFAAGVPVVASRIGVMQEIVRDGDTGFHFNPGDPQDLTKKTSFLWQNPELSARLGYQARLEYERKYTSKINYDLLMDIYRQVIHG